MTVKLKVGRNILDISENDIIMDNGACYQIVTQYVGYGMNKSRPKMSKKLFNDLKTLKFIYTNNELQKIGEQMYSNALVHLDFYKFNVEKMELFGY